MVAWLAFRGGIEWGAPWGVLGAILTLWHVVVRAMHVDTFVGSSLRWSPSILNQEQEPPFSENAFAAFLMEWPSALRTAALVGLIRALLRPQTASTIENMTREGIDLVLTMDLSASMLSRDFRPNRLESAKDVAMDFVDSRPFDRIGVVAYEGEAFYASPHHLRSHRGEKRIGIPRNGTIAGRNGNRIWACHCRQPTARIGS